jgi:hypothetical protein
MGAMQAREVVLVMGGEEALEDLEEQVGEREIPGNKLPPLLQVIAVITVLLVQEVRSEAAQEAHLDHHRYMQEEAAQVPLIMGIQVILFNHFLCIHHQVMQVPPGVIVEEAEAVVV